MSTNSGSLALNDELKAKFEKLQKEAESLQSRIFFIAQERRDNYDLELITVEESNKRIDYAQTLAAEREKILEQAEKLKAEVLVNEKAGAGNSPSKS